MEVKGPVPVLRGQQAAEGRQEVSQWGGETSVPRVTVCAHHTHAPEVSAHTDERVHLDVEACVTLALSSSAISDACAGLFSFWRANLLEDTWVCSCCPSWCGLCVVEGLPWKTSAGLDALPSPSVLPVRRARASGHLVLVASACGGDGGWEGHGGQAGEGPHFPNKTFWFLFFFWF